MKLKILALLALCTAAGSASAAQVRYDFTAFSSFDFNGEMFSGSFSVDLPGFVIADTSVPVSSLTSCTVVASPAAPAQCRKQDFLFNIVPGNTTISFGVQTDLNPGTGIFYYFDAAAFSTAGTHDTVLFGLEQAGRLVVTVLPDADVPLPAAAWLLLSGLGGLGFLGRRRKAA